MTMYNFACPLITLLLPFNGIFRWDVFPWFLSSSLNGAGIGEGLEK